MVLAALLVPLVNRAHPAHLANLAPVAPADRVGLAELVVREARAAEVETGAKGATVPLRFAVAPDCRHVLSR
jgi:hypothetical protein